jgi:hypothetical protein
LHGIATSLRILPIFTGRAGFARMTSLATRLRVT